VRLGWIGLIFVMACYDSTWGERERSQRRNAAHYTPPTLQASGKLRATQPQRIRIFATPKYVGQAMDWQRDARDLIDGANAVLEGDIGLRLEIDSMNTWDGDRDDAAAQLEALRAKDSGSDVAWVLGLVGGFPTFTESFHQLGYADVIGKHLVLRASTDLSEAEAFTKALDELSIDERTHLLKERKRHRAISVLLHEIAHTLGVVHEITRDGLMLPTYAWTMTGFTTPTIDVMRAGLPHHGGDRTALAKDLLAVYETNAAAFSATERDELVTRLRGGTTSTQTIATAPDVPPEIKTGDRAAYLAMLKLAEEGKPSEALAAGHAIFATYSSSIPVQDRRCKIAMQLGDDWKTTKTECEPLMKLTHPNR
jgi:hypothetical protein